VAVAIASASASAVWLYAPRYGRRIWFVPGLRKRLAFSKIKRMEVVGKSEGGTSLVLTFGGDWTWVLCHGRPEQLERLGGALGRLMGLARQDLATWGR
jgi:hypothetical protein